MPPSRRAWILIPLLALLPDCLYLLAGYGGHDFKFHAASWMELHNAWTAHEWRLGWSQWAQYRFGEPRFCFYPPVSMLIGAELSFLLPFRWVPGVVVWLLLSLSGLSMYKVAESLLPARHRLPAAILYMFNPYLLLTVITRFAIAEGWVQAFLPWTFLYFFLAVTSPGARRIGVAALLLALGWLTNIPEAIGIFYGLALLALVLAVRLRSWQPLLVAALSQAVALALAAFRLLPTFQEKSWVNSQNLLLYDFRLYMQLKPIPQPHQVVYLCGAYIALLLVLLVPAVRQTLRHDRLWRPEVISLAVLAAFAILFQTPPTTILWEKLPQFKFILFPYRLLPLLSVASVLLLFQQGIAARLRNGAIASLALFALLPFVFFGRLLPMQRFPSFQAATASWQTGFEGVREYVPAGVPPAAADPSRELAISTTGIFRTIDCAPRLLDSRANEKQVATASASGCTLLLNSFYYPFWRAKLENGTSLGVTAASGGLLSVAVPAGRHQVTLEFLPSSPTRSLAGIVSLAALLVLLAWMRLGGPRAAPGETIPVLAGREALAQPSPGRA